MENAIVKLLKSGQTVFSIKDLSLIWQINNIKYLKTKVFRLVKQMSIKPLKKGIYVLGDDYNAYELANKLFIPSYISAETALAKNGINFQYYSSIYSFGKYNRSIKIGRQNFIYRQVKESVLLNPKGMMNDGRVTMASAERALLDTLYLMPDAYFDNLNSIDWDKCFSLVSIYENKALEKRLNNLYKIYARQK